MTRCIVLKRKRRRRDLGSQRYKNIHLFDADIDIRYYFGYYVGMYTLYLDESGDNTLTVINPHNPHFVIGGMIVKEDQRSSMAHVSEFIKEKYWKDKHHVLHAAEGTHLSGKEYKAFTSEFIKYIEIFDLHTVVAIVNKDNYLLKNPNITHAINNFQKQKGFTPVVIEGQRKIIKESAFEVFTMFLYFLSKNNVRGKIVVEADGGEKEKLTFEAYNLLLSGHQKLQISVQQVRQLITSISFVTKNNYDMETQIADHIVYLSNRKAREIDKIGKVKDGFQKECLDIFISKTILYKRTSSPLEKEITSFQKLY